MKKLILGVLTCVAVIFGASLCGCNKSTMKFTDFKEYKNFDKNISCIEVYWNVGKAELKNFTITDEKQVGEIVNYYSEAQFEKTEDEYIGTPGHIEFVHENGDIHVALLGQLYVGNNCYNYADNSIYYKIEGIGIRQGAIAPVITKLGYLDYYKNFNEYVSHIEAAWGSCGEETIYFTIDDSADVEKIVQFYLDTELKCDYEFLSGNHCSIKFVYENGDTKNVDLTQIYDGKRPYNYTDRSIYYMIREIGVAKGVLSD
ncbi:MAG: hypothetical protein K2O44_01815 [Clostridia bacterium]|nr:hypothetical protein [Clostridia bacterium]